MGRITSGIGLASGINSKDIIDQLMKLESGQKKILQARVDTANNQKKAYLEVLTRLTSLQTFGTTFEKPSTFTSAAATSSNKDVLTATTTSGAAVGNYSFRVARLVTAQQSVSNGFSDFDTQTVGAGTVTIEMGGGELSSQTALADLNGGTGVRRGQFRIYDRAGKSAVIDTTDAVSLDDVVKKINTSIDIGVRAAVSGNKLTLQDTTGSTANNFVVQDLGDGHSAADLGIATASGGVAGSTVTGTNINYLSPATTLAKLNDGLGVRTAADSTDDFKFTLADGTTANVNLHGARTVGDVIQTLNTAAAGKLTASLNAAGDGIKLTDATTGASTFSVTALNNSKAAHDLGIHQTGAAGTINGGKLIAGINTVLLSRLNGGAGLTLGQISITDRAGHAQTIDLSGAKSVQDVLDTINKTTGGGFAVEASLKESGNGIQIKDKSGGTGNLVIADAADGTTTATKLGLVGTFDVSKPAALGANLQRQWLNEATALKSMNGGRGVTPGVMRVTNSAGIATTLDFSNQTFTTLGQLTDAMNQRLGAVNVTVGMNANGDGIQITDNAG
ncbi:MAG TPA: flagellar cap protein FliD N-terminal domain-containing protein, partial [Tepidisphaeraceae bacterium]|nr:flagellar cap protein FliD N-terminal domain-containing protein [Tepidisphaeraceae bacterium]